MSIPSKKNRNPSSSKPENTVNEPEATYNPKSVSGFRSFDEMEDDQLTYFASLSPEELLRNHKKMSSAAYGLKDDPNANPPERIIKFNKDE